MQIVAHVFLQCSFHLGREEGGAESFELLVRLFIMQNQDNIMNMWL